MEEPWEGRASRGDFCWSINPPKTNINSEFKNIRIKDINFILKFIFQCNFDLISDSKIVFSFKEKNSLFDCLTASIVSNMGDDDQGRSRSRSRDRDSTAPAANGDNTEPEIFNIYLTNLSFRVDEEVLKSAFGKFGAVYETSIVRDPLTKRSRGFGFVSFNSEEELRRALEMNGQELEGRQIKVERAKRTKGHAKTPGQYLGPSSMASKRDDRGGNRDDRGYSDRNSRDSYRDVRGGTTRDDRGYDRPVYRDERPVYRDDRRGPEPPAYDRQPVYRDEYAGRGYSDSRPSYRDERSSGGQGYDRPASYRDDRGGDYGYPPARRLPDDRDRFAPRDVPAQGGRY